MSEQERLYEVAFQHSDGHWGATLVTADNKGMAERKARRIGVRGVKQVKKWGNATFLRWVYKK